ncbi:MAG: ABC transporter permease [Oscillospiraceae bacterium]|nr:ABC transporter permease [Oscillospiraceae bacterium]
MKLKFGYFLKEGIKSIFTHGFMSFASVCIIVACLLIMGSFALIMLNIQNIVGQFEDENVVLAFLADEIAEDEEAIAAVKSGIEALEHVEKAEFISRDEAMTDFTARYENDAMFDKLDSSVLAHRYAVYLDDIAYAADIEQQLYGVEGVERVNANLTVAHGFVTVRNILASVSLVIIAILFIISIFIMSNTIKLTTFERREEIAIMRMVGATSSFIRWPFVLEGFILGMVGAAVAFFAQWGLYRLVLDKVIGRFSTTFISFVPFESYFIPIAVVFGIIGFLVGVLGSSLTIKNYLKV